MIKTIFFLLFTSSLMFGANLKANGCDLSQVGDVEFSVGAKTTKKADYKAIAPSGKNFRSILVGSTMRVDDFTLKIVDIKANKRVKRKARTGIISAVVYNDAIRENIKMPYSYDKGLFVAEVKQKDGINASFALQIKALLCHVTKDK